MPRDEPSDTDPRATMSTGALDMATDVAASAAGVFMIGTTGGSLDGANAGDYDVFVRRYHREGQLLWGRQFGTVEGDYGEAIDANDAGYVAIAGRTSGMLAGTRGNTDGFVSLYSPEGDLLWIRQMGTAESDVALGVRVAADGSVLVCGWTYGAFGRSEGLGLEDAWVRKFDANGDVLWTRQFGTSVSEVATAVAVSDSGNVYVTGWTAGSLQGESAGYHDIFVRAYTADGGSLWTRQYGSSADDDGRDIAVDNAGRIIIVGRTSGALFGPATDTDGFLLKLRSDAKVITAQRIDSGNTDDVQDVSVDESDVYYIAGGTAGGFNGEPGTGGDAFVLKYSAANNPIWARQFDAGAESATGVASHTTGEIFLVGHTTGAFGTSNSGGSDAFIRRLDRDGATVWTDQ